MQSVAELPLDAWHAKEATMCVDFPTDAQCMVASELGVLVVARISGTPPEFERKVRRLSAYPAVGFMELAPVGGISGDFKQAARNVLLVYRVEPSGPIQPPAWADVILCPANDLEAAAAVAAQSRLPVIAERRLREPVGLSEARAACDVLQRDLAGRGDFAGYIV
jgi:hypothetical protein